MLVIISDLHFTDGTRGKSISPDAFRIFASRLKDSIIRASWRSNGTYQPIQSVDLILLGDVFDHLRSMRWFTQNDGESCCIRPWQEPNSRRMVDKIGEITDGILSHNQESFALLKNLTRQGIAIPPANLRGSPVKNTPERVSVKVNLHYVVGNHDWFFHLPAIVYDPIRERVIEALGLANSPRHFPHDPLTSEPIQRIFEDHQVFARHGDIFDSLNYDAEKGRGYATLGDTVVIELVGRFLHSVGTRMGADLPQKFLEDLLEIENVRPVLLVPAWVSGLLRRSQLTNAQQEKIKTIWNELADQFLDLSLVRSFDSKFRPFQVVDFLRGAIKFTVGVNFDTLSKLATWLTIKIWRGDLSYARYALEEKAFMNQTARYIVYGHTHHHEIVPLNSKTVNGDIWNQIYVNSGTWHTFHSLTNQNPLDKNFVGFKVLTYLSFFKEDERGGRSFESWNATLSSAVPPQL